MNKAGEKIIPIAHLDDKQQITAVLAITMNGTYMYLAPQLIYQGKTERCHPRLDGSSLPDEWDIWHLANHWSNEETMKRYITKVIVPYRYIQQARKNCI